MAANWKNFILRYLLVAVAGTAVVYFGAPLLRRPEAQYNLRKNAREATARVRKQVNEEWQAAKKEVARKGEDVTQIGSDEKKLRTTRLKLLAEIDQTMEAIAARRNRNNPYTQKYTAANAAYKKFWKKVQELTKKRDQASGADHVQYEDELRRMKGQDIKLAQDLEAAKRDYLAWKRQYARDPVDDQTRRTLRTKLNDVEDRLAAIDNKK